MHTNPEEAVAIHAMIAKPGAPLVPVHWATFNLAFHDWSEPVERLLAAAEEAGVATIIPMPGGRVDGAADVAIADWWSTVR